MPSLNNVTTANDYTLANTLECPIADRFNLRVNNASVYLQFTARTGVAPGGEQFMDEIFLIPGIYPFNRKTSRIRVRSGALGVPAQVTIDAFP